jgi:hypothetical protein
LTFSLLFCIKEHDYRFVWECFLGGAILEIELRASGLLRQALYCLSHTPSPFAVGLFFREGIVLLPWLAWCTSFLLPLSIVTYHHTQTCLRIVMRLHREFLEEPPVLWRHWAIVRFHLLGFITCSLMLEFIGIYSNFIWRRLQWKIKLYTISLGNESL